MKSIHLHKKNEVAQSKIVSIPAWMFFLIGALTFILLIATYTIYSVYDRRSVFENSTYVNPTAKLLQKKDLIVDFQELRNSLGSKYENRNDYMISVYFEYLPTGANISINKDEKIWPASLIKVPIALAVMKKVENKTWDLDNELVILGQDKDSEYGNLYKEETGTTLTIKRLLEETLANSDNTAHFVLLRNLDGKELEDVYIHLGMDDVIDGLKNAPQDEVADNRITGKRYSIFFRSLYNSTYLTPEYSELFLSLLKKAPKELLSFGVPENVPFLHKTGIRIDEKVRADSGIVYVPGRPYIITVMIQQKKPGDFMQGDIDLIFKEISQEVYTYVTQIR